MDLEPWSGIHTKEKLLVLMSIGSPPSSKEVYNVEVEKKELW